MEKPEKSKKKMSASKKIMLAILLGPKGGILLAPVMLKKLFPGIDITAFLLMKMGFGALFFSLYKKLKPKKDGKFIDESDTKATMMKKFAVGGLKSIAQLSLITGSIFAATAPNSVLTPLFTKLGFFSGMSP